MTLMHPAKTGVVEFGVSAESQGIEDVEYA